MKKGGIGRWRQQVNLISSAAEEERYRSGHFKFIMEWAAACWWDVGNEPLERIRYVNTPPRTVDCLHMFFFSQPLLPANLNQSPAASSLEGLHKRFQLKTGLLLGRSGSLCTWTNGLFALMKAERVTAPEAFLPRKYCTFPLNCRIALAKKKKMLNTAVHCCSPRASGRRPISPRAVALRLNRMAGENLIGPIWVW